MAAITIRKLEDSIKTRLRMRAASHGRSMEEEAHEILKNALNTPVSVSENLAESIRRRMSSIGGIERSIPPREPMRDPPDFSSKPGRRV